jgi:hypothetical protein
MTTETVTARQLVLSAHARMSDTPVEGLDPELRLELPGGGVAKWSPETAIAVAGHIYQHWTQGSGLPLIVERYDRITAGLRSQGTNRLPSRRIRVSDGPEPTITEMCGHEGCDQEAPAGPGSRCTLNHITDRVPRGEDSTYWARIAAEAWAATYNPRGQWAHMHENRRNGIVRAAYLAGMPKTELHQITGIARTTIDRILEALGLVNPRPPAPTPPPADRQRWDRLAPAQQQYARHLLDKLRAAGVRESVSQVAKNYLVTCEWYEGDITLAELCHRTGWRREPRRSDEA